jgi:GTPase SAR1 family protein
MVFDLRLKKNFKIFLSGPSGCGKTTFISDLITNLDQISVDPPKKVIYFYKEWQTKFTDMEQTQGVNFIEDNDMIIEQIKDFSVPALVIFDDMLNSENLKAVAQLFTVFGRHLNLCLAFLTQRLFNNNEFFRQISQNSDYIGVFKNPRNSREIRTLASQITPKTLELLTIYQKATKDPYSYVLINLTQEGLPQLKYISNVFSKNQVVNVYVPTSCK